MALLAADIGNTDTALGLITDGDVVAHWRVSTQDNRTSDEWAVLLRGLIDDQDGISGIAVCSTVPAVASHVARAASSSTHAIRVSSPDCSCICCRRIRLSSTSARAASSSPR